MVIQSKESLVYVETGKRIVDSPVILDLKLRLLNECFETTTARERHGSENKFVYRLPVGVRNNCLPILKWADAGVGNQLPYKDSN